MTPITSRLGSLTWAHSFHYRDFRQVCLATLLLYMSRGMERVALGWLVLELTDSALMLGLAFGIRQAPQFLLGVPAGAVADNVNRRMFAGLAALAAALVTALLAIILASGSREVSYLLILTAVAGSVWVFIHTTRQAYTYDIVGPRHALSALALTTFAQRVGGIAGSLLAGVVILAVSVEGLYGLIASGYALAFIIFGTTRYDGRAAPAIREPVVKNLIGYLTLIRQNQILMVLMLMTAIIEIFGFSHQSLLPMFARDTLKVGVLGLGVMHGVASVGGMLGALLLVGLGDVRRKGMLMLLASAATGLGLVLLSYMSVLFVFLWVLLLVNVCSSSADTFHKTLIQSNVPNEQRGVAMGSYVVSEGMGPIGHTGVGAMAAALGPQIAILINGGILALIGLGVIVGMPWMRRVR